MAKGPDMDLSSFTDILTCVLGIIILIILLTGIDASTIKVLIPTPKELSGDDKSPVFFECRNNSLFYISPDEIKKAVDQKTEELLQKVENDEAEFLRQAATTHIEIDGQKLDFTYAMLGRYVLVPIPGAEGRRIADAAEQKPDSWYGTLLSKINPETQFICFFVRPDSFKAFQKARALAWLKGISVSVELQDERNPIMFGPGGEEVKQQ